MGDIDFYVGRVFTLVVLVIIAIPFAVVGVAEVFSLNGETELSARDIAHLSSLCYEADMRAILIKIDGEYVVECKPKVTKE